MESDTAGYIEFFVPTPIYTSHVLRIAGPVNGIGRTAVAMRPTYASQALRLAGRERAGLKLVQCEAERLTLT